MNKSSHYEAVGLARRFWWDRTHTEREVIAALELLGLQQLRELSDLFTFKPSAGDTACLGQAA